MNLQKKRASCLKRPRHAMLLADARGRATVGVADAAADDLRRLWKS